MAKVYDFLKFKKKRGINMTRRSPEYLERLAEAKLYEYGMNAVPIDPAYLAELCGIVVLDAEFDESDISGMITKEVEHGGVDVTIYVNRDDLYNRKRFTIAHELGHYFLHLDADEGSFIDKTFHRRSTAHFDPREYEANGFAAALLMPRNFVTAAWESDYSISEMAGMFNVSEQAMSLRLKNLGLM